MLVFIAIRSCSSYGHYLFIPNNTKYAFKDHCESVDYNANMREEQDKTKQHYKVSELLSNRVLWVHKQPVNQ